VCELLAYAVNYYEIAVYTAALPAYADYILRFIRGEARYITHVLSRSNCYPHPTGQYLKDLRQFTPQWTLEEIVFVDNNSVSFCLQPDNCVPILGWYGSEKDVELLRLIAYLELVRGETDVRVVNRGMFCLRDLDGLIDTMPLT
jgi:TFIIF-interacting CTD phosphatase-like protein